MGRLWPLARVGQALRLACVRYPCSDATWAIHYGTLGVTCMAGRRVLARHLHGRQR